MKNIREVSVTDLGTHSHAAKLKKRMLLEDEMAYDRRILNAKSQLEDR